MTFKLGKLYMLTILIVCNIFYLLQLNLVVYSLFANKIS